MLFICYNCLNKINKNIYKAHDKNFCCKTCRENYFIENNYNYNNIDKFIDNKYFNITLTLFKKNNKYKNQYHSISINNIDYFIKNIEQYDTNKFNKNKYMYTIKHNFDNYKFYTYQKKNDFYNNLNYYKNIFNRNCNMFDIIFNL